MRTLCKQLKSYLFWMRWYGRHTDDSVLERHCKAWGMARWERAR